MPGRRGVMKRWELDLVARKNEGGEKNLPPPFFWEGGLFDLQ